MNWLNYMIEYTFRMIKKVNFVLSNDKWPISELLVSRSCVSITLENNTVTGNRLSQSVMHPISKLYCHMIKAA